MRESGRTSSGVFRCELILFVQQNLERGAVIKRPSVFVCDYDRRLIWHDGFIIPQTAPRFAKALERLNRKKGNIFLYIRGPGGDPHATLQVMQMIAASPNPILGVAHGVVSSGCFTITQACTYRLAMPGTKLSFHPAVVWVRGELTQERLIEELE